MNMAGSLAFVFLGVFLTVQNSYAGGDGGGGHKHVVIHVPFKVKTIHHTHTIVKHVGGGGGGYKVIGYSGGIDHGQLIHSSGGDDHHIGGSDLGGHETGEVIGGGHGPELLAGGHDWSGSEFSGGIGGGHFQEYGQGESIGSQNHHISGGDWGQGYEGAFGDGHASDGGIQAGGYGEGHYDVQESEQSLGGEEHQGYD